MNKGVLELVSDCLQGHQGKEVCGEHFSKIREKSGVAKEKWFDVSCLSVKGSTGKGGAFFVTSSKDPDVMVKSLNKQEASFFKTFAPVFVQYLMDNPHSLLMRVYGLYKVDHLEFMLIENVLNTGQLKLSRIYDLKGSVVHRRAKDGSGTQLDLNWNDDKAIVLLEAKDREIMLHQIEKDSMFLSKHNLMDYSLLVGIYEKDEESNMSEEDLVQMSKDKSYCFISYDRQQLYFLGIIDYLQEYNLKKKLAHGIKSLNHDSKELR